MNKEKSKSMPVLTHTEIYSRAIRSIDADIGLWEARCSSLPAAQADEYLAATTQELRAKRSVLETLYRIESGADYD